VLDVADHLAQRIVPRLVEEDVVRGVVEMAEGVEESGQRVAIVSS
jgi:hypothetical protein